MPYSFTFLYIFVLLFLAGIGFHLFVFLEYENDLVDVLNATIMKLMFTWMDHTTYKSVLTDSLFGN